VGRARGATYKSGFEEKDELLLIKARCGIFTPFFHHIVESNEKGECIYYEHLNYCTIWIYSGFNPETEDMLYVIYVGY